MKQLLRTCSALTALVFLFSSCAIEKRKYVSGYHLEWKNSKSFSKKEASVKVNKYYSSQKQSADTARRDNNCLASTESVESLNKEIYFSPQIFSNPKSALKIKVPIAEIKPVETIVQPPEKKDKGTYGILSFSSITLGLLLAIIAGSFVPLFILILPAILFGAIGMGKNRKHKLLAVTGLWLALLTLLGLILFFIAGVH